MPLYPFVTLDVFTDQRFGGNPLAVFPTARGLSTNEMQALAREFNMSEVAFVLPATGSHNTAQVRIFTPELEIDFAGHPNVGVGWVLADGGTGGGRYRLEQGAGVVEVEVGPDGDGRRLSRIGAPQPLSFGQAPDATLVAACAGLAVGDIGTPRLCSVGLQTLCVPVARETLDRAACDPLAFQRLAGVRPDLSSICLLFLYACEGRHVEARMFAPLSGAVEDPATGSAASALVALLLSESDEATLELEISQGVLMGRPSRIYAAAHRSADGIRASVGGRCVYVLRGEAEV